MGSSARHARDWNKLVVAAAACLASACSQRPSPTAGSARVAAPALFCPNPQRACTGRFGSQCYNLYLGRQCFNGLVCERGQQACISGNQATCYNPAAGRCFQSLLRTDDQVRGTPEHRHDDGDEGAASPSPIHGLLLIEILRTKFP